MRRIRTTVALVLAATAAACGSSDGGAVRAPSVANGVSSSICSPMTYGGAGQPGLVVAMVGPLQGPVSDHGIQNAESMKLVMQQRGWRAGKRNVAIQVCDEASEGKYVDLDKCKRNAEAFAGNASVIAVIGPTVSSCAAAMIPVLNSAEGGPIGEIGLGNTYLGLTRSGPGVEKATRAVCTPRASGTSCESRRLMTRRPVPP
jgi:hypothetical protein